MVAVIDRDWFSGGRNIAEDPDAKLELADLIIEMELAINALLVGPVAHAASHVTGGGDVIANAVPAGNAGLMSGADKTHLDGIEPLADVTDATNVAAAGAIMAGVITAQGDILVGDATPAPAVLPIGAAGQVLTVNPGGTDPAWDDVGATAFVATEAVPGTIWAAPPGPPVTIQDAIDRIATFLAGHAAAPIT